MDRYGYWNKLLHVDLTERRTWIEEPGDVFFRRYGGGRGIIAHYLLKHVPKGADPLGPDNLLIFAPGVLTGAPVPGAGRHSVGAKSPLTGGFGESEAGGFWGAELKRAGWDGMMQIREEVAFTKGRICIRRRTGMKQWRRRGNT